MRLGQSHVNFLEKIHGAEHDLFLQYGGPIILHCTWPSSNGTLAILPLRGAGYVLSPGSGWALMSFPTNREQWKCCCVTCEARWQNSTACKCSLEDLLLKSLAAIEGVWQFRDHCREDPGPPGEVMGSLDPIPAGPRQLLASTASQVSQVPRCSPVIWSLPALSLPRPDPNTTGQRQGCIRTIKSVLNIKTYWGGLLQSNR